jgi:hypothetical protein
LAFWKKKIGGKKGSSEENNSKTEKDENSKNDSEVADEAANSRVGSYFLASRSMHWLPVN